MVRLLAARDLHRLLGEVYRTGCDGDDAGPEMVVAAARRRSSRSCRAHPVVAKVLVDERELIGLAASTTYPEMLAGSRPPSCRCSRRRWTAGYLARRDPVVVAEWLARIGVHADPRPAARRPGRLLRARLCCPCSQPEGGER